jgi:hypothetical protein
MVVASAEGKKYLQKSIEKYLEKSIERDAVAVASVHLPALGAHWSRTARVWRATVA